MYSDQEWENIQDTYRVKLTQEQRKIQRKESQHLHKTFNKLGVKVQLKPSNNDKNQAVIKLPNELWLMVVMENGLCYHICEDRDGSCINYYYDDGRMLITELPSLVGNKVVKNLQSFFK